MILKLLLVLYASGVVHEELLQLNCICVTPLASLADNVNVVFALYVYAAHALMSIVPVGGVVSKIVDFSKCVAK